MFLAGGVLSVELTNKIKCWLKDCKHLEDNEIDLINCLLSTHSRADINSKKEIVEVRREVVGPTSCCCISGRARRLVYISPQLSSCQEDWSG